MGNQDLPYTFLALPSVGVRYQGQELVGRWGRGGLICPRGRAKAAVLSDQSERPRVLATVALSSHVGCCQLALVLPFIRSSPEPGCGYGLPPSLYDQADTSGCCRLFYILVWIMDKMTTS